MSRSTNSITVCVVIATYNRAKYIGDALDSVLVQTRPADEIVVVDDGSTDNTPAVVRAYGEQVRYLRQDNHGKPRALNSAIPQTRSSHLLLFDDDDALLPDALATHVDFLEAHADIDYSHSRSVGIDGDQNIWNRDQWRPLGYIDCRPEALLYHLMDLDYTLLQSMLIPRRCLDAVGPFDEQLLRAQDYDMVLRLARRFRGGHVPEPTFVLRNHQGQRGPATGTHAESDRGNVWRRYDREIFRDIHRTYHLAEYLVSSERTTADADLTASQIEQALLRRSEVMFRHGLFTEGAEDIQRLFDTHGVGYSSEMERVLIDAANINDPLYMTDAPVLARALRQSFRGQDSQPWLQPVLRSLYWTLRRALQQRLWRQSRAVAHAMSLLARYRGSTLINRESA